METEVNGFLLGIGLVCATALLGSMPSARADEPDIDREEEWMLSNFDGIYNGQFGNQQVPPNVSGGVGKQGILQTVNTVAAYYPKSGPEARVPYWSISLSGANSAFPASGTTYDPRAWYDAETGRFVIAVLEIQNFVPKKSYLHLAISKAGHPMGKPDPGQAGARLFDASEWHRFRYDLTRRSGEFSESAPGGADYPALGVDASYLYLTANFREIADSGSGLRFSGELEEAGIFVFDKASLFAGTGADPNGYAPPTAIPRTYFPSPTDGSILPAMTWEPARTQPAQDAAFLSLDQDAVDTFVDIFYTRYPGGTGFVTEDDQTDHDDMLLPPPMVQPGAAPPIATRGDRMTAAVRFKGTYTGAFVAKDNNDERPVIRLVTVAPGGGNAYTIQQLEQETGVMPSLAAGPDRICLAFTSSSTVHNPAIMVRFLERTNGTAEFYTGSSRTILESATPYLGSGVGVGVAEWGDYAHVSTDPDNHTFWVCQPYARGPGPNEWGTRWFNLTADSSGLREFSKQIHLTTATDPTPQFGTVIPQGEVGTPVRTIKVKQGHQLNLNVEIAPEFPGDPILSVVRWYRDGVALDEFPGTQISIPSVTLGHQGYYHVTATNNADELSYSEEIYLDVVVPPVATMNQSTLRLHPAGNSYLEVLPDPALRAEMDVLGYSWNRVQGVNILDGKVRGFTGINSAAAAAAVDGQWVCTVSNMTGSTAVSANVMAGPRVLQDPMLPSGAPVLGPTLEMPVEVTGISDLGAAAEVRADFTGYASTPWRQAVAGGVHSVAWRKDDLTLPMGGRFSGQGSAAANTWRLFIASPDYEDEGMYDCVVTDVWGAGRAVVSGKRQLILTPLAPPYITVLLSNWPEPRTNSGMVYDSQRKRTVLFGGEAFGPNPRSTSPNAVHFSSNDTWEWDGKVWLKRNPATRPPPMSSFGIAYDNIRGRTVVFGGYRDTPPNYTPGYEVIHNDVWEWDGNNWTHVIPSFSPPARLNPVMCFDSARGEVLMLGGSNFNPEPADYYGARKTLWGWNGVQWTQRGILPNGSAEPYVSGSHAFAFDPGRGRAVLFGPFGENSYPVWEWDGTVWARVIPPITLRVMESRFSGPAFFDPVRRRVGLPIVTNNVYPGISPTVPLVLWWDGSSFLKGETSTVDDINNTVLTGTDGGPFGAITDLTAFDIHRRCLVWHDSPNFINSGSAYTREMHFSAKAKHLHQPVEVAFAPGGVIQLRSIQAGQRPLTYQWFKDGVPISNGGRFSGANTATLSISGATGADTGNYTVQVTNAGGQITTPAIRVIGQGSGLAISVQGSGLVLTWSGSNGVLETSTTLEGAWTTIPGATSPYPAPTDEPRRFYRVRYP